MAVAASDASRRSRIVEIQERAEEGLVRGREQQRRAEGRQRRSTREAAASDCAAVLPRSSPGVENDLLVRESGVVGPPSTFEEELDSRVAVTSS